MSAAAAPLVLERLAVERAGRRVLDDVSVTVAPGEIVAVIGPNGAGKTTLLHAAVGAVPLWGGTVRVGDRPLARLTDRARWLAFLDGEAEPPAEVGVRTLLDHACAAPGAEPALRAELERRLDLAALGGAPAGTLSRGERRRLLLFAALVSGRPFLLLDEPTGVFDPLQLIEVITLFRERAARGAGLLVTVHQMSDAEALASRLVLLDGGRVLACDTLQALRARAGLDAGAPLERVFLALLRAARNDEGARAAP